jgi:ATP-dependent DNA helicase RecQ
MIGCLRLSEPAWTVAILERDVPCAELAVRDWVESLHHLCQLYGIAVNVERVHLLIAEDHRAAFPAVPWRGRGESTIEIVPGSLDRHALDRRVDLAIDVSVAAHPTRRYPTDALRDLDVQQRITLRTAQRQGGYIVDPWPQPRRIDRPLAHQASLEYFLRTLFRKRQFRPGQLPIVERVLRRDDVIGLLPTGAGKSITFQLPALLSPGLTLVIDPIKSLMQDQVENLETAGVMDSIQINSDTSTRERSRLEWQFAQGEYRLLFVSPERLQIQKFRDLLKMTAEKRPVGYVVIDEAHCVSEWGHDFRTAYLNLGRIVEEFCGRGGIHPPIVALTGTASEAVLRDIQRELGVEADDAIVRPAEFARDELKFAIFRVPKHEKPTVLARLLQSNIPKQLGVEPDVLASGACGGIVFCPLVNGLLGVYEVAEKIGQTVPGFSFKMVSSACPDKGSVAYYSGAPPGKSGMKEDAYASHKAHVQRAFKSGRIPLLVATSAFGMGIDKPNIRYTIHYAMAKSVEAFAQEAGRAGRDRHTAICAVLFTDNHDPSKRGPDAGSLDCLERGISAEEARERAEAAKWGSDDAETQIFLHTRGYQGIKRESAAVRAFYQHWIEPKLVSSGEDRERAVEVVEFDLSETEYRERIEVLMAPLLSEDAETAPAAEQTAVESVKSKEPPRPDLQRLIYRLSLLGIVADYTVVYSPVGNVYTLSVPRINDADVIDHLFRYVARYRTSERLNEVRERLEDSQLGDVVSQCVDVLCWFVYSEIEQRRRQAMENMRQMLREATDGADLARRINEMLSFTALTRTVFDVLQEDDHRSWARISDEITAADSAERVYYQCRRALEDSPDHPGLLLLLGLAQEAMDGGKREQVVQIIKDGLGASRKGFSKADRQQIASWVMRETVRIAPSASTDILARVVREESDSTLPAAILQGMEHGAIAADPILERTCQRRLLHRIDDYLQGFMSA